LLVNPWIHDFAAYDFWAKPLGLLQLAGILMGCDIPVSYIDCLDRFHTRAADRDTHARSGRGPYLKTPIAKPAGLEDVPRTYSRYGIKRTWFRDDLAAIAKPDLVLVTSLMTYWYPGVQETIREIRTVMPDVPVVLGGVYASLCFERAQRHSGADRVVAGAGENLLPELVREFTGYEISPDCDPDDLDSWPYPGFELQNRINYIPLMTSRGCPYACDYCASHFLAPRRQVRHPVSVAEEIGHWHREKGVVDFAFYDDALLVDSENHAIPMLQRVVAAGIQVRFHTPNALHVREINQDIAALLFQARFKTIRLGLETASFDHHNRLDVKVTEKEFFKSVTYLREAGFQKEQIGAYLLFGLPGQAISAVEEAIDVVKSCGVTPVIAHYTPIPHTALWQQAVAASRYDLEADPVFTNNAVMPCSQGPFSWQILSHLKQLVAEDH